MLATFLSAAEASFPLALPSSNEVDSARARLGDTLETVCNALPSSFTSENTNAYPSPVEAPPPSATRMAGGGRCEAASDDADLVRSALAGDSRALVAIWRRYVPLVRSKLARSIGAQDVDDHVQEVFRRLFEYLPQLRDPSALRSFIIGISLRIAGTELRRRRCRWWLNLSPTGELPEPCTFVDDGETRQAVWKVAEILGKLTPEGRRFFELRYVEERELVEVADAMNVSLATAKRHLARIAARVQAMVEREPALAAYASSPLARQARVR